MPAMPELRQNANGTFRIDDWQVFGPGYHKGKLYTLADCWQVVDNFNRLSTGNAPYIRAKVRLGHDTQQQLASSLGLPNAGQVVGLNKTPRGFSVNLDNIPKKVMVWNPVAKRPELYDIEEAVRNGNYNDGSVEYIWKVPDPVDPSKFVIGPVMDGIALLGGERPAVPGQDSPTIPSTVFSACYREIGGRQCEVECIAFSEMFMPNPAAPDATANDKPADMSRDQILEALKAQGIDVSDPMIADKTDEELQEILKQGQGDQFSNPDAGTPPMSTAAVTTPAQNPAPADMQTLMSEFRTFMADMGKRIGGCEQAIGGMQKDSQTTAQFAADFQTQHDTLKLNEATDRITKACSIGKVSPFHKDLFIKDACLLSHLAKDVFAAGVPHAGKTPFSAYLDAIDARPVDEMMVPLTVAPVQSGLSDFAKGVLEADQYGKGALRIHGQRTAA